MFPKRDAGKKGTRNGLSHTQFITLDESTPLKAGSSSLGLFRLPSAFASAAAARLSFANLSRPSIEVLGVGGSNLAGALNACS